MAFELLMSIWYMLEPNLSKKSGKMVGVIDKMPRKDLFKFYTSS